MRIGAQLHTEAFTACGLRSEASDVGDGIYVALSGAVAQAASLDAARRISPRLHRRLPARADGVPRGALSRWRARAGPALRGGERRADRHDAGASPADGKSSRLRDAGRDVPGRRRQGGRAVYARGVLAVGQRRRAPYVAWERGPGRRGKAHRDRRRPSSLRLDATGQLWQDGETRGHLKLVTFPTPCPPSCTKVAPFSRPFPRQARPWLPTPRSSSARSRARTPTSSAP